MRGTALKGHSLYAAAFRCRFALAASRRAPAAPETRNPDCAAGSAALRAVHASASSDPHGSFGLSR